MHVWNFNIDVSVSSGARSCLTFVLVAIFFHAIPTYRVQYRVVLYM